MSIHDWVVYRDGRGGSQGGMYTILWLIAVIMVITGIYVILARRELLWGLILIVVGLLIGPGGVSIFNT